MESLTALSLCQPILREEAIRELDKSLVAAIMCLTADS